MKKNTREDFSREKERKEIRKRMFEQSIHLNNRTNSFLIVNSILIAGIQLNKQSTLTLLILIVGLVLAIIWLLDSVQSRLIIKELSIHYHKDDNEVDKLVENKKFCKGLRPTDIFTLWVPIIFLVVWIILIFIVIFQIK